jgi:hypothetical protein
VHVATTIKTSDLRLISALVMVVADVTRLVHVFDAVDQKPQCETAILDRLGLVLDDEPELVDLVDYAAVLRIVRRPLSIVVGLVQEDVDVVPRGGLWQQAAVLVRSQRGVCKRFTWFQQLCDRGLGLWSQVPLRESGDYALAEAAPGEGRSCRLKCYQQSQQLNNNELPRVFSTGISAPKLIQVYCFDRV